MDAVRAAVERLYDGICTVIQRQKVRDDKTGKTYFTEMETVMDEPCHLSYEQISAVDPNSGLPKKRLGAKLILAPETAILPGSKIIVTQNGRRGEYKQSGEPAVYASHQEIRLELFDEWA